MIVEDSWSTVWCVVVAVVTVVVDDVLLRRYRVDSSVEVAGRPSFGSVENSAGLGRAADGEVCGDSQYED